MYEGQKAGNLITEKEPAGLEGSRLRELKVIKTRENWSGGLMAQGLVGLGNKIGFHLRYNRRPWKGL